MENVTLDVKAKRVGNSFAIFVPADVCETLDIEADTNLVAHIHKKKEKNLKALSSLYGILKNKSIPWDCKEDRLHEWRD